MTNAVTPQEMRWFVARGAADASQQPRAALPPAPSDRAATLARIAEELDRPGSAADRYLEALRTLAEHAFDVHWAALLVDDGDRPSPDSGSPVVGADSQSVAAALRNRAVRAWLLGDPADPHALAGLLLAIRDSLTELASEAGSLEPRSNRALVEQLRRRLFAEQALSHDASRRFYGAAARALAILIAERAEQRLRRTASTIETAVANQETTMELAGLAPLRTLARERALERLVEADPRLGEIYRLATFAGRNPQEIADLLGAVPADVEADLETATVEVCLDEL